MFQRILVPLDGSERAEQALPVAARLARASNGTVILVQAVYPPSEFMELVGTIVLPEILDEKVAVARMYLEDITRMSALESIRIVTKVVIGSAHPAQAIIAEAIANQVDLVVMCSHGYTGVMRWALGSIAEKVVRHASSPVFILQEGRGLPNEAELVARGPVRVLVPLDGSKQAETSILPAALLASALSAPAKGELHLTRVVAREAGHFQEERQRAHQYLGSVVERWQTHSPTDAGVPLDVLMTWSVTVDGDPASGIIRAAENGEKGVYAGEAKGYQVIAMATHGLGGLQLWAMGSTTERVLQVARQPLLIVRR